jgi:hypothetical protein
MPTFPASLQLTLPLPPKHRKIGVVTATAAYSAFLLVSKFLLPSAHERAETVVHLLAETAFQTILFAVFFIFLRFIWPRKVSPMVNVNRSIQFHQDQDEDLESDSVELTGTSAQSRK